MASAAPSPAADAAAAAAAPVADFVDGIVQLSALKDDARNELLDILTTTRGRKGLIVDLQVGALLNQVVAEGSKFFKENGVQYFRELKDDFDQFVLDVSRDLPDNFVYLVRPHAQSMKLIAQQIKGLVKIGNRCQFRVYFVPSQSTVCMHLLEEYIDNAETLERITFKDFKIGLIPFDADILTLEDDCGFRELYSAGDLSSLSTVAQALQKIQGLFGVIPNIKVKGALGKKVLQQLLHLRKEEEDFLERDHHAQAGGAVVRRADIDTMIILDRDVDLVSPLVTPLTYEGLIDDALGIANSKIKLEAHLLGADEPEPSLTLNAANKLEARPTEAKAERRLAPDEKVTVVLNSSDSIYAEIRNLSIERIGSYMQEKAIHIRERYAAFKENKDASLAEIHAFVKKIPKLTKDFKSLNQHIHIAELLKTRTMAREFRALWQGERGLLEGESFLDEIEDLVCADAAERSQLFRALRLLCLQSATSGGLKAGRYDAIRRALVQTYGVQLLHVLAQLERAGLVRRKDTLMVVEGTPPWQLLRRQLRLIDEKVNMARPEDISFVAAGYAPLSVRLVQMLVQPSGRAVALEAMRALIPGDFLEIIQHAHKAEELADILARNSAEAAAAAGHAAGASGGMTASSLFQQVMGGGGASAAAAAAAASTGLSLDDALALSATSVGGGGLESKKVMLVVVLGGVSFLELSAFRFLTADPQFPFRIIVASTKVVNGASLLQSLQL